MTHRKHHRPCSESDSVNSTIDITIGGQIVEVSPEVATTLLAVLEATSDSDLLNNQLQHTMTWFSENLETWQRSTQMTAPNDLLEFQQANFDTSLRLASKLEGECIKQRCEDMEFQNWAKDTVLDVQGRDRWGCIKFVDINTEGKGGVTLRLFAGGSITLDHIRYCGPLPPSKLKHPPRGARKQKRGVAGAGCYPALETLGIIEGITPRLASEVGRQVCECSSMEDARERLARQNIHFSSVETVQIIAQNFGLDGLALRYDWVRTGEVPAGLEFEQTASSKKLLITMDAFKTQVRENKRGPIPKGNKQHGYHTRFTDVKTFTIRELDGEGDLLRDSLCIIEGTLGNADDMFTLLELMTEDRILDLTQYEHIVVGGDGGTWITNRLPKLVDELAEKSGATVWPLLDWYHATEHLWKIAKERSGWTRKQRERWVKDAEGPLYEGDLDGVLACIEQLCVGRKAKKIRKMGQYFKDNAFRINYRELRDLKLPIGTGSIESAGRLTINLRLKASGIFWRPTMVEGMTMMRSYLKSGNWKQYERMVMAFRARRFNPEHPSSHSPTNEVRERVTVKVPMTDHSRVKRTSGLHAIRGEGRTNWFTGKGQQVASA